MEQYIENYLSIKKSLPNTVKLIAVSKTVPVDKIQGLYNNGQRIFGESKVQELTQKFDCLPKDIEWHFIGHLQSNKIKYIAPFINYIHSIDSYKILEEINKLAAKNNRTINCLLQVHIAKEETKFGFSADELKESLNKMTQTPLNNIFIKGLMGMATFTNNEDIIRNEFKLLKQLFIELKNVYFRNENNFNELSMGMSDDYLIAINEGSTMIRLGSKIFGDRIYK
jgi:PLP dependent protein